MNKCPRLRVAALPYDRVQLRTNTHVSVVFTRELHAKDTCVGHSLTSVCVYAIFTHSNTRVSEWYRVTSQKFRMCLKVVRFRPYNTNLIY